MKKKVLFSKPVLSWALYDWGNSAFATTVMAGLFPVFYSSLTGHLSAKDSQFWFNITLAISSILVGVSAPLLGAIADRGGTRKKFLVTFACLGVVMTAGLAWVQSGMWWVGLLLYGLGTVGFAGANIFYDSLLVEVAEEDELDMVSSFGYAMGYIGGGLLFAVNVLMITKPGWFGLPDAGAAVMASFIMVTLWWAGFTIPLLLGVDEPSPGDKVPAGQAVREGVAQLISTLKEISKLKVLLLFLVGYWLYIDAVNTVIKVAVFFGGRVLNLPQQDLVTALLVTQFVAFPAALGFGRLGKKIGPRPAILIGLGVYLVSIIYAWRWLDSSADFYKLAVAIGLVQGGVQSLSRSLYARLVPKSKAAEFFGFFNMVGKFAAFLGPLLMAAVPIVLAGTDERDGILSLSLLFIIGGFLLWKVDVNKGVKEARAMDDSI
jgi:UMF1 family MFS transporter